MTQATVLSIKALLSASLADESTLKFPVADSIFGMHAQQAVEKVVKALIGAHNVRPERTHDLRDLFQTAATLGDPIPSGIQSLDVLTGFAGEWRYWNTDDVPPVDRVFVRKQIAELRLWVTERIRSLRPDEDWSGSDIEL